MKTKLVGVKVGVSNLGSGYSCWRVDVGKDIYFINAVEDEEWTIEKMVEGYATLQKNFRSKDPITAFQKGFKEILTLARCYEPVTV